MQYKRAKKTGITLAISTCFYFFIIHISFSFAAPIDSIGIEKLGNKIFILHQVDPRETLFSLSRKYNVKTELIEIENPEVKIGLKVGQVLRIPYQPKNQTSTSSVNSQNPTTQKSTTDKESKTHLVEQGQTLYSISRIYNTSVDNIKKWNNLSSNELSVGQAIIVASPQAQSKEVSPNINNSSATNTEDLAQEPSKVETKPIAEPPKNMPNFKYDPKGNKVHITESGQTLFNISQIYNISVDDIKKWNGLGNNEISTGQEIVIEKVKEKEVENTKIESSPKTVNTTTVTADSENSSAEVKKVEDHKPEIVKPSNNNSEFNKVVEKGLAESIEESIDTPKFLALHKTAGIGTIIQVKNELNNLYIFARVIGKLPQTGANEKLVIKLSKKAYDKLGAIDKRFPVVISYVPNN